MPIIKRKEKVERTSMVVRIDIAMLEKLRRYAVFTNVTVSEIVESLIASEIASNREFLELFDSVKPVLARKAKVGAAGA
jgi:hypothetical protein